MADKNEWTKEDIEGGGVRFFTSLEECNAAAMQKSIEAAKAAGYDTLHKDPSGNIFCGKESTAELVEVFQDGTWEYRDSTEDETKTQSGLNAMTLGWYLSADAEGRKIFED
jgi:hypothetical protein